IYEHYFGEKKKAIEIIQAYNEGEAKAAEHVDRFMELLAICFANLFTGLDPHVVALGGGLSNFELIYEEMPKRIPKYLLSVAKCPKIIKAKHGDSGGVRGAAFLNIK
ncbi:ROK family protein, partial [Vibrio sp. 10N.261.45.A7]